MIYWQSVAEFAHMGGYGGYVWGAFGLGALLMMAEIWQLRARRRGLREPDDETPA